MHEHETGARYGRQVPTLAIAARLHLTLYRRRRYPVVLSARRRHERRAGNARHLVDAGQAVHLSDRDPRTRATSYADEDADRLPVLTKATRQGDEVGRVTRLLLPSAIEDKPFPFGGLCFVPHVGELFPAHGAHLGALDLGMTWAHALEHDSAKRIRLVCQASIRLGHALATVEAVNNLHDDRTVHTREGALDSRHTDAARLRPHLAINNDGRDSVELARDGDNGRKAGPRWAPLEARSAIPRNMYGHRSLLTSSLARETLPRQRFGEILFGQRL